MSSTGSSSVHWYDDLLPSVVMSDDDEDEYDNYNNKKFVPWVENPQMVRNGLIMTTCFIAGLLVLLLLSRWNQ
jgi:hypothetical protein